MKMIRQKKMMKLDCASSPQARQSQLVSMKIWTMRIGTRSRCRHWELKRSNWDMIGVHVSGSHLRPGGTSWLTPPIQVSSDSLLPRPDQRLLSIICTICAEACPTFWNGTKNKNVDCKDFYWSHITYFNSTYLASGRIPFWRSFQQNWKSELSMKQN